MKLAKEPALIFLFLVLSLKIFASGTSNNRCDTLANNINNGEFTLEINGLNIWYKVSGRGPVCIMPTPGWGLSSDLYFNSLKEMEELFTMVYIDTRGSGRSGKPDSGQYTLGNFISDIDEVRKSTGVEKVWLLGNSKAGTLILQYALVHPKNTKGLILIDASVGHNLPAKEMQRRIMEKQDEPWFQTASSYMGIQFENEKDFDIGVKSIMPLYFYSTENYEKNKEILHSSTLSFHAYQGRKDWWNAEKEVSSQLSNIKAPSLVIVGMDDIICAPSASQYIHREIPNSKFLLIEKAGHFPWLEQPDQFFNGIKDFLPKLGY